MFRATTAFIYLFPLILSLGLIIDCKELSAALVQVERSSDSELRFTAYFDESLPELKKLTASGTLKSIATRTALTDPSSRDSATRVFHAICFAVPPGAQVTLENLEFRTSNGVSWPADEIHLIEPIEVRGLRLAKLIAPARLANPGANSELVSLKAAISFSSGTNGLNALGQGRLDRIIRDLTVNRESIGNWYSIGLRKPGTVAETPFPQSNDWLRIAVTESGVYRITGDDLERAGASLSSIDPDDIRLFYAGGKPIPVEPEAPHDSLKEMAILVEGSNDGIFGREDALVFYAHGADFWDRTKTPPEFVYHPYSNRNVYYLALSGDFTEAASRINSVDGTGFSAPDTASQFIDYIRREENQELSEDSQGDIFDYYHWYWGLAGDIQLNISLPEPSLQSVNAFSVRSTRSNFTLHVNGTEAEFDSTSDAETFFFHTNRFRLGVNQIDVDYVFGNGYIDWLEIGLKRELTLREADDLTMTFPSSPVDNVVRVDLNGVSSPLLLDISDPYQQRIFEPEISGDELVFGFNGNAIQRSFIVTDAASLRTPFSIVRTQFDNITSSQNGADLIVIGHDSFANVMADYVAFREQSHGFRVRPVNISDIYAHFSGGRLDPIAIRDFLRHAYQNWQGDAPSYCLLAGDGVYDFRNNKGFGGVNYVPPFIVDGDESVSDENFVYFGELFNLDSDDSYPADRGVDMVISRWPVKTVGEFETVLDKTRDYEQSPETGTWRNLLTLIADDENHPGFAIAETFHTEDSETLATSVIPPEFVLNKIYGVSYPFASGGQKPEMRSDIIKAFNDGSIIVNYIGHGNPDKWADESIFRRREDIPLLNNVGKLPLVFNASCSIGFFDQLVSEGMAEDLLSYSNGGAVGTISATRLVYSRPNFEFNKAGMEQLLGENDYSIAEAVYVTKLLRQGVFGVGDNDRKYIYIGEPLTRLAIPPDVITFTSFEPDSLVALTVTELAGRIESPEGELRDSFEGDLTIRVFDNQRNRSIEVSQFAVASFWEYGPEIYRGKVDIVNGEFDLKFVVPKDITYGGREARISAYAIGSQREAVGVLFPLAIGSINKNVSDSTGPDMTVYFGDTPGLSNGATVAQNARVTVELFDTLGINLSGEIGHGIEVSFDDDPEFNIEVTDSFTYFPDSYQRGKADFDLPQLSIGEHTMKVKAWDSANNSNQVELNFSVTADEGLAITELLCYPNPVSDYTEFSYVLSDDAEDVTLKLFTISGLEIWSRSDLPGTRGYNGGVAWDGLDYDGDKIANGVYIFQLSANPATSNAAGDGGRVAATGKLVLMK